jgi:primosomal protein N' (replication factor Y)
MSIVSIMPLRPVSKAYSYLAPTEVQVGQVVRIPFGRKREAEPTLGVVWSLDGDSSVPRDKLKGCEILPDWPILSAHLCQFLEWSAEYTLSPLGSFLRMALPIADVTRPTPQQTRYVLASSAGAKTPARQKVVNLLMQGGMLTRTEIKALTGVSDAVIAAMAKEGVIEGLNVSAEQQLQTDIVAETMDMPQYNAEQQIAADQLKQRVQANEFSVTLLDGVTGSGKTEVYFAAIQQALLQGKQALVLMPEIALTTQFISRFTKRFGVAPITWHSHLTPAQRRRHLKSIVHGQARVILGARSALFLPYAALGVVIIDEEHDSSYKQEEGIFYNARDLGIKRAQIESIPMVLVSATPSLETYHNAQTDKYHWVKLPARYADAQMPQVKTIDMRAEKIPRTQFLSPTMIDAMRETLEKGEQVMLYLNRRGYAPLTLCRTCGHHIECPRCSAWLVQHRTNQGLMCHHCGWQSRPPKTCPSCNAPDSLTAIGPGVERIEDEVRVHFADKRIAVLSSDTQKSMTTLSATLDKIANKEIDILIGTQIVAKGHHFPQLTLVGVVDADLGLGGGDLRAGERTFQILQQVSGRAGRGDKAGQVLLQSFMPEHRIIKSIVANERDAFLKIEAEERMQAGMPPAGRLAGVIISAKKEDAARRFADHLAQTAPVIEGLRVLGPAQAPIFKLRHQYRYRLLVKGHKGLKLQSILAQWVLSQPAPSGVRVQIDIDPYSFM